MKLWERIQRGMEAGFDATLTAVHNITEKAGESIELTRLRREKARLEAHLTRALAQLGNTVYEAISKTRDDETIQKLGIDKLIKEVAINEARMVDIDLRLGKELKKEPQEMQSDKEEAEKEV